MATPKWLALVALVALAGCFQPIREPDCLADGTCECKVNADCQRGELCVDGKCFEVPDAGTPGELGWPCTQDSECLFGPCLPPGPGNGRVCSAVCALDGGLGCDKGWDCKQGPTGTNFLCAPPIRVQCLSCTKDSDCNAIGDRCSTIADAGFCTTDCSLTRQCPAGNVCRPVDAGFQCFPTSNTCECSAIAAGLTRSCKRTNPRATCFGDEVCQADGGWSGCDALEASDERCDGLDNDCDGLTDQADPDLVTSGLPGYPSCRKGLTCAGLWSCGALPNDAGFGFSCSAPDPKAELCNGADDDCNGQIDDGLVDAMGNYVSVRACGSCATDCHQVLDNLLEDGGVVVDGAASCELRNGQRQCVPRLCAKGSYLTPPGNQPQACERAVTSQCRPCTTSADCRVPGDECVNVGNDPDPFCAQSCDVTAAYEGCTGRVGEQDCCPAENTCRQVGARKLCVPDGNSCQCTPARAGFQRSCVVTQGTATCIGNQTCSPAGAFGLCDTSQTSLEFCDGRDNDCDGQIDDGFVNTRGSGTYDTDAHCGACNVNCPARWSPTIQHAIGGCGVTPGQAPRCVIASCTTERVGGGGACRIDADCTGGATCHRAYRQCVRACTTQAQCRAGEACTTGFCTPSCNGDAQCVAAFGQGAVCSNGTCGFTYQFVNVDRDETNGCECASNPAVPDEPERYATYPTAGLPYVDRNCDQVDGNAARSLFVWAQSASSQGTRTSPFRTIGEAVRAFNPAQHDAILVAQGIYDEQVVLRSGVQLHGGYSADFTRRDIILFPTFIEAAEPTAPNAPRGTVNAENLSARTVLAGFTIRGYDVNSQPQAGQPAKNSYAVYVRNAPALVIQNNHVVGGRGGDGTPAAPGLAGANGPMGQSGLNARECNSPDCTGEAQIGGAAGVNPSCSAAGNPGAGTTLTQNPQGYPAGGSNGAGGSNATYAHSDPSQTAFCKYDCTVPGDGLAGGAAQNGSDGTASGQGLGCTASRGLVIDGEWVTPSATAGRDGTPGRGGGGGGGGGCVRNATPPSCTIGRRVGDLGGTGGGGGAGGCGGGAGSGAAGGGGSFGIFVVGGAPTIDGNLIDFGFGGAGGNGGAGGYGGLGGQGGRGGTNTTAAWCAGQGGPGGRGGNGGAGSGGGGGCGGSVFGIAGEGIASQNYQGRNTIPVPAMSGVGAGGVGGASPAGPGFRGGDGSSGILISVESF